MISRYRHIFNLYLANTGFVILAAILLVSAVVSKFLFLSGSYVFSEEMATVLFVMTLWLAFHFGVLIKRQFASPRASLLPGYRRSHLLGLTLIYAFFLLAAAAWLHGLRLTLDVSPAGTQGIFITCFLVSLIIIYLGYLSIGRALIYSYVVCLLMAMNVDHILTAFEEIPSLKYLVGITAGGFIIVFLKRLLELKESHFEYHSLLSWPPKTYFVNQLKSDRPDHPLSRWLKIGGKRFAVPPYPRDGNLVTRALHWDLTERHDLKIVGALIVLAAPLYLLFLHSNPAFADFFKNTYSNFLLLSMTPALITLAGHYKKMAYWGHDLLKPVGKRQYLRERGLVLILHLLIYWSVFVICFAVIPNVLFHPELLSSVKFAAFIVLTGNAALLVTAWLSWLSCVPDPRAVIVNGVLLSGIVIFLFYFTAALSPSVIWGLNGLSLCAAAALFAKSYQAWSRKEYV